jgi:hypothetical protein
MAVGLGDLSTMLEMHRLTPAISLADAVARARSLALAPEQSLLRMIDQRRASRRVVEGAIASYREAADLLEAALPPAAPKEESRDE